LVDSFQTEHSSRYIRRRETSGEERWQLLLKLLDSKPEAAGCHLNRDIAGLDAETHECLP